LLPCLPPASAVVLRAFADMLRDICAARFSVKARRARRLRSYDADEPMLMLLMPRRRRRAFVTPYAAQRAA